MGWVKLIAALIVVGLLGGVAVLFGYQNSNQTAALVLDVYTTKLQSSKPISVPVLMAGCTTVGLLAGLFLPGPFAYFRKRRANRLQAEIEANSMAGKSF